MIEEAQELRVERISIDSIVFDIMSWKMMQFSSIHTTHWSLRNRLSKQRRRRDDEHKYNQEIAGSTYFIQVRTVGLSLIENDVCTYNT